MDDAHTEKNRLILFRAVPGLLRLVLSLPVLLLCRRVRLLRFVLGHGVGLLCSVFLLLQIVIRID